MLKAKNWLVFDKKNRVLGGQFLFLEKQKLSFWVLWEVSSHKTPFKWFLPFKPFFTFFSTFLQRQKSCKKTKKNKKKDLGFYETVANCPKSPTF